MVRLYGYTYDKVRATLNYPNLWCNFQKTVLEATREILKEASLIVEILTCMKEKAKKIIQEKQQKYTDNRKLTKEVNKILKKLIFSGNLNLHIKNLKNILNKNKQLVSVSGKKSEAKVKETTLQNIIECLTDFESASKKNKKGFFGYKCESGDLSYKNTTTIELKYIRQGDKPYEIRNALGQTLENAIVSDLKNAVLLIWDEAYSEENWDEKSEKFISMFINNPFGINFAVIRIRVYENHCTADIYL